jgi:hypothetical protein
LAKSCAVQLELGSAILRDWIVSKRSLSVM